MSKKLFIILGLAVIILVFICFLLKKNEVKVGVLFSSETTAGSDSLMTVRLYEEKRKKKKSRPRIKFIYINTSPKPEDIRKKYKELVDKGVSLILAGELSRMGVVIQKEANRYQVPTILIGSSTSYITRKKDYIFSILSGTNLQSHWISDYLYKKGSKKLMVLMSEFNRAYTKSFGDTLLKAFQAQVSAYFYKNIQQFELLYKKQKPDTLFMALPPNQLLELMKYIREKKYPLRLYSSEWLYIVFPEYKGEILNGVIIPTQIGHLTPEFQKKNQNFKRVYEKKASMYSDFTSSALGILEQTLIQGYTNREEIHKYLGFPRKYKYSYGTLYWDEYGDAIPEYYFINRVEDGELKLIEKMKIEFKSQ